MPIAMLQYKLIWFMLFSWKTKPEEKNQMSFSLDDLNCSVGGY